VDPATLTAIFGGISTVLGGVALVLRQLRPDEEDFKKLRARNEELENDMDELRNEFRDFRKKAEDREATLEAKVWKQGQILRQNGIDPDAEVVV